MIKNRSVILILIIMLAISAGYLWMQKTRVEQPGGAPAPAAVPPAAQQAETRMPTDREHKEEQVKPAQDQMVLSEEAKQTYNSPANDQDFNETMRREEKKPIQITPGIAFQPGKGVSIKKPGSEESIQIRRDNTYRADELKVQWEKKF